MKSTTRLGYATDCFIGMTVQWAKDRNDQLRIIKTLDPSNNRFTNSNKFKNAKLKLSDSAFQPTKSTAVRQSSRKQDIPQILTRTEH